MTQDQILIIGGVAMVLAQLFKVVSDKLGWSVSRQVTTVVLFVISMVIAYVFTGQALPAIPAYTGDPSTYAILLGDFLTKLIAAVSALVGFATLVYNLLLQKVFEKLGFAKKADPPLALANGSVVINPEFHTDVDR